MQYCSLQHRTLLLSPVTPTTGCCFCFGSIPSFFLEFFLHWSPVAYWAPTDLGSSSFSVLCFCLFLLFSRQEYWSGLPFPSPVDHILSDLSTMTRPSWVVISHASKVMLKILQARLQQYVNHERPHIKPVLEKAKEPEIKLPTSAGSSKKKQKSSRKMPISALLTMPKPLTVWITRNCGKNWKWWEYQTTWPASWETYMQVRKQQLNWTWNNRLVPNRKRSTSRLYIVTLLI